MTIVITAAVVVVVVVVARSSSNALAAVVQTAIHIIIIIHSKPGMTHNYMLTLKQLAYRRDCYGHTRDVYFYDQSGCGESILPTGKTKKRNKILSRSIRSSILLLDY